MPRGCRSNHTLDRTPHHSLALVAGGQPLNSVSIPVICRLVE